MPLDGQGILLGKEVAPSEGRLHRKDGVGPGLNTRNLFPFRALSYLLGLLLPLIPLIYFRESLGPILFPLLAVFLPPTVFWLLWEGVGVRDQGVRKLQLDGYLYLYPALLVLGVFHLYPVFYALRISFYESGAGNPFQHYVGLKNFQRLLADATFWNALSNTAWYAILSVVASILVALVVALLLNQKLRGLGLYRTVYFLPVVTSVAAVSLVWKLLFDPRRGLLNEVIGLVGLPPLGWLQEGQGIFKMFFEWIGLGYSDWLPGGPALALVSVVIMSVWKVFGYNVVIFLAGLQNIPEELYEAATIDGATSWDQFRHITWPLLSPTTFFILVMSTISSFQVFAQIFMLYGGQATETSRVIVYYLYEKAFQAFDLGYAAAIAVALFLILFTLTILQRTFVGAKVHYANSPT
jgi:multiple sugar transport system permease protein